MLPSSAVVLASAASWAAVKVMVSSAMCQSLSAPQWCRALDAGPCKAVTPALHTLNTRGRIDQAVPGSADVCIHALADVQGVRRAASPARPVGRWLCPILSQQGTSQPCSSIRPGGDSICARAECEAGVIPPSCEQRGAFPQGGSSASSAPPHPITPQVLGPPACTPASDL